METNGWRGELKSTFTHTVCEGTGIKTKRKKRKTEKPLKPRDKQKDKERVLQPKLGEQCFQEASPQPTIPG